MPVLFNKDTFFSDIQVSSIYLHDTRACEQDRIKEGESGWVLQGVVSKACFRRQPRSGQKNLHGNVCAHQQQLCQKAWNWEEASPHYPRRDAGRALLETSTELLGADQMVTAVNPPVLSKKPLPTQIFLYHLAPHRGGGSAW